MRKILTVIENNISLNIVQRRQCHSRAIPLPILNVRFYKINIYFIYGVDTIYTGKGY